jgi:prepilin-type N-terminal cleavage/methylation domain-containing protein
MKNKGYTLIELVVAMVVLGILVLAVAKVFQPMIQLIGYNTKLSRAVQLSAREFSIVNSLQYTDAAISNGTNLLQTNLLNSGLDVRRQVSYDFGSDASTQSLKRITVIIYATGATTPMMTTVTLRAKNVSFGP